MIAAPLSSEIKSTHIIHRLFSRSRLGKKGRYVRDIFLRGRQ